MRFPSSSPRLFAAHDVVDAGERAKLYRAVRSGDMLSLHPGVHVAADAYRELASDERYRLRVRAAARRLTSLDVISHWSAAALWGLPAVDGWPADIHSTVPAASGLCPNRTVRRHRTRHTASDGMRLDGLPVTSLARTVVDVAASANFPAAVAAADAALFAVSRGEHVGLDVPSFRSALLDAVDELGRGPGSARARRVIAFADERANRPGESLSRVTMHAIGAPPPALQHRVVGASGRVWHTDFGWPEFGAVAEFDGRAKYVDPEFLQGRRPEDVVYDEKRREDDIRAAVRAFGRWDWRTARSPQRMAAALHRLGVPLGRR